jgi:hypothetical protein
VAVRSIARRGDAVRIESDGGGERFDAVLRMLSTRILVSVTAGGEAVASHSMARSLPAAQARCIA